MPVFQYKAADVSGDVFQGEMEAANEDAVIRRLQELGHIPIRAEEVLPAGRARLLFGLARAGRRPGHAEAVAFTSELATLLRAGLPLERALATLAGIADSKSFRNVLEWLHAEVRGGTRLSAALGAHPRLFPRFYRDLVEAGEAAGTLDASLARVVELHGRSRALRDEMLSALLYPLVLAAAGVASLAIILALVLPEVAAMFSEAGQSLPWFTQTVVTAGEFLLAYGWVMVLAALLLYAIWRWQNVVPSRRARRDAYLLRLPLVGPLIVRIEAARFLRTLSTLVGNGVPLTEAVPSARERVSNEVVAGGLQNVAEGVRRGDGLARPLAEARVFPPLTGHLLQVGEESGNLESMLAQLANIYDGEVQSSLRRIAAALEPAVVFALTLLVGSVILSIVLAVLAVDPRIL